MKDDPFENRHKFISAQNTIPPAKLLAGSTKDKFAIVLDGGKTIIFISDLSKKKETIERYENRSNKYGIKLPG
jgi:hypothetical protein